MPDIFHLTIDQGEGTTKRNIAIITREADGEAGYEIQSEDGVYYSAQELLDEIDGHYTQYSRVTIKRQ